MKDIGSEDRLACDDCSWVGPMSKAKTAPNPFNKRETLIACPKCKALYTSLRKVRE